MNKSRTTAVATAAALALTAASAGAATLDTFTFNTTNNGSVTTVPTGNDADGSYQLQTTGNADKASIIFATAGTTGFTPLGTLGNLTGVAIDSYRSSTSAASATNDFAYRLILSSGATAALVWENNYNGNAPVPTDTWRSLDLTGGNYWQRGGGKNFNGGSQALPLSTWDTGTVMWTTDGNGTPATNPTIDANTMVYGLEVAYGSGAGAFLGNIDHVNLTFGTGGSAVSYTNNAAVASVPEPTALAVFAGAAGLLSTRRRRVSR